MAFAKSASVDVTTWGSSFKKRLLPRSVHWKEGGRYSCIALANASSNSPSLYHKNLHVFECCGVPQRISMIHFDSGGSLNGTYHFLTFEEDTLLEGKTWESIKFSHIQKAGPNQQCTRLCVRVDFDSIKVSLSKNSVSSIWISSCRGFAAFFERTPTSTTVTPFQLSKIRVLPPPAAPHGVSLARSVARWDVGATGATGGAGAGTGTGTGTGTSATWSKSKVEWIDGRVRPSKKKPPAIFVTVFL